MKLLVVRFSSLGDCILLCPFLEHLKRSGAQEVAVVTKRAYWELFGATRGVDRVVALGNGRGGLRQVIRACRQREYVIIDAHNNLRSRLLAMGLGGADVRIRKYYRHRTGLIMFKHRTRIPAMRERYSALGEALGYPPLETPVGGIVVPPAADARADALLANGAGKRRDIVAVAPGSRWAMKRWGEEKYVDLARRIISAYDAHVVLVGDTADAAMTARITAALGEHVTDIAGQTSLMETAAVLRRARAFIGNDSGLMHLAEAVGVPVIGLFGPTVDAFGYFPALEASKVVERDLDCRPCSRNGSRPCPRGTQECLVDIPVDAVEQAFDDLVEERGPSRYILQ